MWTNTKNRALWLVISTVTGRTWYTPGMILDPNNVGKTERFLPWDELSESYYKTLCSNLGRPTKDARIVIGAVIIKHKLSISDEETVEQIRENPYLQYFIGLKGFQAQAPFAPSLLVEIRKRMGQTVFDEFYEAIIETVEPIDPANK